MSDRSPEPPHTQPRADPTRDIRLPPLPDRPAPAVPAEWASYVPPADATPTGAPPDGARAAAPRRDGAAPRHQVDEPTDRLASPSDRSRDRTLSFTPPPSVQLLKVSVTPRRRRSSRVLWALVLLTLAVIVACGVYLVMTVVQR